MLDPIKNLVYVNPTIGYSAAAVIIQLGTGEAAKLPDPAVDGFFNLIYYNHTDYKNPADDPKVEIVRVTGRDTGADTITITRAQEGTSATTKNEIGASYRLILGLTKKMIDDIATAIAAKQDALGFTAENIANKSTNVVTDAASDTKYPSVKAIKDYADSLVTGLLDYRGAYNASGNTFPATGGSGSAGAILKGDLWVISNAGTLGGVAVQVGDSLIANTDTPGQTAANWNVLNSNISYVPEDVANKVTSISGASTDTQYPSAKLVYDQLALMVAKSLFDANTILYATTDNTPAALTIGASTIVGRKATGDIVALTAAELRTIINVADGATANAKATSAEINTGTDDTKFVTPDGLAGAQIGKRIIQLKIVDDATALTTGDGKLIFMIPVELNGMNLVDCEAFVTTVSSSGLPTIQIRNVTDSVDMLSTRITIDASEFTSLTATTAPVIDATHDDVATGDLIAIDVDVAGTGAKGLGVQLSFQLP